MTKTEILELINKNPAFHLGTVEGDQPRVRGMLLYKADEDGIIFHTADTKDVFAQLMKNPKAELCFNAGGTQIRVSGVLELVDDDKLRQEIINHPSRQFVRDWINEGVNLKLQIFRMKNGTASLWTMQTNFAEKEYIKLG